MRTVNFFVGDSTEIRGRHKVLCCKKILSVRDIVMLILETWHLLPKIKEIIFSTFLQMDDDRCRNAKQTFVFQFWREQRFLNDLEKCKICQSGPRGWRHGPRNLYTVTWPVLPGAGTVQVYCTVQGRSNYTPHLVSVIHEPLLWAHRVILQKHQYARQVPLLERC